MLKKKIMIFIAIIIAGTSCNDWLDLDPVDGVMKSEFWKNKEDVHSAVIGCYTSLLNQDLMTRIIYWGELRGDMVTPGNAGSDITNIVKGEISTGNKLVTWDKFYTTINQCNDVLKNAATVMDLDLSFTSEAVGQYEAEAAFIRALMYFYLVRSFSDVPFITEVSESDTQDFNVTKADGAYILNSLVEDLEKRADKLPVSYGDNASDKGRFTQNSAKTLLADMYLWLEKYDKCNNLCAQIINSGKYSLVPVSRQKVEVLLEGGYADSVYRVSESDVNALFDKLYVAGNSVESIFEIQFPKNNAVLKDPFYPIFNVGSSPALYSKDEIVSTVIFPEYAGADNVVYDIRTNTFSWYIFYIWKWSGLARASSSSSPRVLQEMPNWIVYRYPDVLLMKAEALTQMAIAANNNQEYLHEALSLVKQIRDRANAVEYAESIFEEEIDGKSMEKFILAERAREFAFEGKRWYDVLRQAKRNNFSDENYAYLRDLAINAAPIDKQASMITKYKSKWFCYWPIHYAALEANPLLVQNEFYIEN